jgi:hypothetical protein
MIDRENFRDLLHCKARREAPSSLKSEPGATSAGPIFVLLGLIHTIAASFSKNL